MNITVKNKPKGFTENQIIETYVICINLKQFGSTFQGERHLNWEIKIGRIYIEGYDTISPKQTVITRYVNDEEG